MTAVNIKPYTNKFNRGEVDSLAIARDDVVKVNNSAEEMTNFMPIRLGPMMYRPGMEYLDDTKLITITGTINPTASTTVAGVGTLFTTELNIGSQLTVTGETRIVTAIASDTSLTVDTAFTDNANDTSPDASPVSYFVPFVAAINDVAALEFNHDCVRFWVDDALLTTTTVDTAIGNGTFDADIAGWNGDDGTGAVSAWLDGGYMRLTGTGTESAVRYRTTTGWDGDPAEHRLRIVIKDAPVLVEIGNTVDPPAAHAHDLFKGVLGPGTHSLVFTPTDDIDITFSNSTKYRALVDSVAFETTGTFELPTDIDAANIDSVRFSQSADVIFISWNGGQQFKIERRGVKSWSIVDYESDDGPFGAINDSDVTLTPSALSGGPVNLTASKDYFLSTDVGAMFRLISQGQEVTATLTAQDTGTNSIKVTGIEASRIFVISATGFADSTLTLQRSSDDTNWTDVESYTVVQLKNYDDGFDNSTLYYRLHIKTGDYGTDTVVASLEYEGGGITGICRVTGFTSATVVVVNVLEEFGRTDATRDWYRGEWDSTPGYPTAVSLYEGRLWWAGRDKAWGSVSDAFTSFDDRVEGDSAPIPRTVGFGPVAKAAWLMPLSRLVMGITSDTLSIRSNSFGNILTPENTNVKPGSSHGAALKAPLVISSRGYYVQRALNKIFELEYSLDQDIHDATDLCVLNPSICSAGIKRIAVTMEPEIRIYVVLDDGNARVYLMDKTEEVRAWSRIETDGDIRDIIVLPGTAEDRVYFQVSRTNGMYFEKLALFSESIGGTVSKTFDSFKTYTSPGTTISGLDHVEGQTVYTWADGQARDSGDVVNGGSITVSDSWTDVVVGLRYTADYTTSPVGQYSKDSVLMYDKRIVDTGFILRNYWPMSIKVGPDSSNLKDFPDFEGGKAVVLTATQSKYNQKPFSFDGTMETDPRIHLQAINPCTILAMTYGIDESNDPTSNTPIEEE